MTADAPWQRAARGAGLLGADGSIAATIFAEMSALATRTGAINLGQGFPDEDGPAEVLEAARAGHQRRASTSTRPAAACPCCARRSPLTSSASTASPSTPRREVLVTAGATEALAATILALVDAGDEVVTFEPFYDSYGAIIGARPRRPPHGSAARARLPARPRRAARGDHRPHAADPRQHAAQPDGIRASRPRRSS